MRTGAIAVLLVSLVSASAWAQEPALEQTTSFELGLSIQTGIPYVFGLGAEARLFERVAVGAQYGVQLALGPHRRTGDDGVSDTVWRGEMGAGFAGLLDVTLWTRAPHRVGLRALVGRTDLATADCGGSDPPVCSSSWGMLYQGAAVWGWRTSESVEVSAQAGAGYFDYAEERYTSPGGEPSIWIPVLGLSIAWLL